MFAELIFILLAIIVLLLIDSFSTLFGLISCALIIYCCVYNSCIIINKRSIVHVARKLWASISFCFHVKKQVYSLYERIFLSGTNAVSPPAPLNTDFCGSTICLENEINTLVSNISQYYIQSWYGRISSDDDFLHSLNSSIKQTLVSLCTAVSNVDKKKFSYIVMQVYLHFFSHFNEAKKKSEIFKKENFKIKHWAMKDNTTEWCYLQSLVSTLLDSFCPSDCEKTLHSKYSPLLHTIIVEILTQNIIQPLVRVLSDPARLNSILLKVLINAVKTNEDAINNSTDSLHEQQGSFSFSRESNKVNKSPIILLPHEDLSDDSVFMSDNSNTSPRIMFPDLHDYNISQQGKSVGLADNFFTKDSNKTHDNFLSLASTGLKSCSNANLQEFSDRHCYNGASDTSIKRSKSADYIRQLPQLKALNEKYYNIVLQSETNKMLIALKPDTNSSIEQAEEAIEVEVPTLFTNVKITDTFLENEDSLPYTRYCIQYTGVFHDTGQPSEVPHFVQQVVSIKRRFKEFIALQSSLEDNQSLRIHLKAIRAPSKWLLPFSNLDKKHIAERRIFLENYMNQLCSLSPIAQSAELQEFLAYGRDKSFFARKNAEATVPRIDKMLVRGVKGAFDMIKTALPNSPLDDENPFPIPRSSIEDVNNIGKFQEHLLDYSSREPEIKEHITNFMENSALNAVFGDLKGDEPISKRTMLRNVQTLETTECCNCPVLCDGDFLQEKCPFGNTAFELMALCTELVESNIGEPFSILKLLFAPFIDGFFVNKLDKITEEHLSTLLHMLHKYLWPDERGVPAQSPNFENTDVLNTIIQHIEDIFSPLFPFNAQEGLTKMALDKVYLLLSSFQNQEINRCLLFHIFDAIIEATCL